LPPLINRGNEINPDFHSWFFTQTAQPYHFRPVTRCSATED
jgi:hypothetical protein